MTDIMARSQRTMKEVFLALEVMDRNMELNINQSKIKLAAGKRWRYITVGKYGTNNYYGKP